MVFLLLLRSEQFRPHWTYGSRFGQNRNSDFGRYTFFFLLGESTYSYVQIQINMIYFLKFPLRALSYYYHCFLCSSDFTERIERSQLSDHRNNGLGGNSVTICPNPENVQIGLFFNISCYRESFSTAFCTVQTSLNLPTSLWSNWGQRFSKYTFFLKFENSFWEIPEDGSNSLWESPPWHLYQSHLMSMWSNPSFLEEAVPKVEIQSRQEVFWQYHFCLAHHFASILEVRGHNARLTSRKLLHNSRQIWQTYVPPFRAPFFGRPASAPLRKIRCDRRNASGPL